MSHHSKPHAPTRALAGAAASALLLAGAALAGPPVELTDLNGDGLVDAADLRLAVAAAPTDTDLRLPAGSYVLGSTLELPRSIRLTGSLAGTAHLRLAPGAAGPALRLGGPRVELAHLRVSLDPGGTNGIVRDLVELAGAATLCRMTSCVLYASADEVQRAVHCRGGELVMRDCAIWGGWRGVAGELSSFRMDDSSIRSVSVVGIELGVASEAVLLGNRITADAEADGIVLAELGSEGGLLDADVGEARLVGNQVSAGRDGVVVRGALRSVHLEGNVVEVGRFGLRVTQESLATHPTDLEGVVVSGNVVRGTWPGRARNGIHLERLSGVSVHGNSLQQLQRGIVLREVERGTVSGNVIQETARVGIRLDRGTEHVNVQGNTVQNPNVIQGGRGDRNVGISLATSSGCLISGNLIHDVISGGIAIHLEEGASGHLVASNRVTYGVNGREGLRDEGDDNRDRANYW